jgi:ADP-ribose pyrophosphatase YjhB (NUDIX family)
VIPLDRAHLHVLVPRGDRLVLEYRGGDRASPAHDALAAALRIGGQRLSDDLSAYHDERIELQLDDGTMLDLTALGYQLSPFELRYASDHGHLHPIPVAARTKSVRTPTTDLHTHFAGCVSGIDLVAMGASLPVSKSLLDEAGVHIENTSTTIGALPDRARERLAHSLSVPVDKRITFVDMERIYRLRGAITKAPPTFIPMLRRLAEDYATMGIGYVELSLGSCAEARVLREIHANAPKIEEETGVTVRFLLALNRHDDPEWDEDLLRRLAQLAGSIYVAGIDVMGHETNSTHAFAPQLRAAAAWATAHKPGFVIRVHAGESPSHPENVRIAIEETAGQEVQLRIGHGLYGVDDATLEAAVRAKTIIEMNLDSNVALNHIASGREAPLRRYLDAGARVVLGSDGYGIYGASADSAARAALVCGMKPSDLEGAMRITEEGVIEQARERDRIASRAFVVPDDLAPVAYTEDVATRRRQAIAARDEALGDRLAALELPILSRDQVKDLCSGRRVVSIAGAWKHSWDAMDADEQKATIAMLTSLVDALGDVVLLTGGTRFGVEGFVGERAKTRGIPVIGTIVSETEPASLDAGAMAHAHIIASSLYEKGARLYELVEDLDGACVFVGGGQIVRDEIQAAKNLGLPYIAFAGIGASGAHAAERPAAGFHSGVEAAYFIGAHRARIAPHWFVGPNPTVDAVVIHTLRREVLLIRRSAESPVEPGAWALPGGFIATDAVRGEAWRPGRETEEAACLRELAEETALVVGENALRRIGVFEGGGRDPRDSDRSHSRSTAFLIEVEHVDAIAGGDDADDARWFPLDALPRRLAFDHARIVEAAEAIMRG